MQAVQRAYARIFGLLLVILFQGFNLQAAYAQTSLDSLDTKSHAIYRPPFVIVINNRSTPSQSKATQKLQLSDFISPQLELSLTWKVRETIPMRLVHDETTGAVRPVTIPISTDETALVRINHSRERLTKASPGEITLSVQRPQELVPGVYRGEFEAEFTSDKGQLSTDSITAKFPVLIVVHGRAIRQLSFDKPQLAVGVPGSMTIKLETIGCSLGEGQLSLQHWEGKQPRESVLQLSLDAKNFRRGPFVPRFEFAGDKLQMIGIDWWDSVLHVQTTPARIVTLSDLVNQTKLKELPSGPFPAIEQHTIKIHFGDCPRPGFLQAKLQWGQDSAAPGGKNVPLVALGMETKVGPGIYAPTKTAYEGEALDLVLFAEGDLSANPKLRAASPGQKTFDVEFSRREQADVEGQSSYKIFDGRLVLETPDSIAEPGRWVLGFPKDTQLEGYTDLQKSDLKLLMEQKIEPISIDACFQYATNLEVPLEVFASTEPIWWPLFPNEDKAGGWVKTRSEALQLSCSPLFMNAGQLGQIGWLEIVGQDSRELPYDGKLATGPLLSIQPTGTKSEVADGPPVLPAPGVNQAATAATDNRWEIPAKGNLSLDLTVSLMPDNEPNPDRHRLCERQYSLNLLVMGKTPGQQPIYRVLNIPFAVSVSSSWKYDMIVYLLVAGLFGLVSFVLLYHRIRSGKKAKGNLQDKKGSANSGSMGASHAPYLTRSENSTNQPPAPGGGPSPNVDSPPNPPSAEVSDDSDYLKR